MNQVLDARGSGSLWRSVRGLPDFWRLLQLRVACQFGDGKREQFDKCGSSRQGLGNAGQQAKLL